MNSTMVTVARTFRFPKLAFISIIHYHNNSTSHQCLEFLSLTMAQLGVWESLVTV